MRLLGRRQALSTLLGTAAATALPAMGFTQSRPAKRIFIVHSYEKGHVCGEPQAEGILDALKAAGWPRAVISAGVRGPCRQPSARSTGELPSQAAAERR